MPSIAAPSLTHAGLSDFAVARRQAVPLMPALLVVAALLPADASFSVSGLFMSMPRMVLLLGFPLLLLRLSQQAAQGDFRASLSDWALWPAAIWMYLSVAMTNGVERATVASGADILEFVGAYLTGRCMVTDGAQARGLAAFAAVAIAAAALLGPLDTITGRHIVHDLVGSFTHYDKPWRLDFREGVLRAQGAQEHPIMLGMICAVGALLSLTALRGVARIAAFACCVVGMFSSLSSAAIMGLAMGLGLLLYRQLTPDYPGRWPLIGSLLAIMVGSLMLFHPQPFGFIFTHFTLDPATGWYRLLIWQVAGALVLANPVFGIGVGEWARESWMPDTVDAVWLRLAMVYGIVGAALIAMVVAGACSRRIDRARASVLTPDERTVGVMLGIILFVYIYVGFTVHFWGCNWVLLAFFAGLRARMGALAATPPRWPA